jgi:hypothetical protein
MSHARIIFAILRKFSAARASFHSARALASPRMLVPEPQYVLHPGIGRFGYPFEHAVAQFL